MAMRTLFATRPPGLNGHRLPLKVAAGVSMKDAWLRVDYAAARLTGSAMSVRNSIEPNSFLARSPACSS